MIWLLQKFCYDNKKHFQVIALECAKRVSHLMKDERSIEALRVTELYLKGEATKEELIAAASAAYAAYADASVYRKHAAALLTRLLDVHEAGCWPLPS